MTLYKCYTLVMYLTGLMYYTCYYGVTQFTLIHIVYGKLAM